MAISAAALVLTGCPKPATADALDAGPSGSELDASIAEVDAGPPTPTELRWSLVVDQRDGGQSLLAPGADLLELEPASKLTLHLSPAIGDVRIRLLDGTDKLVASDDRLTVLDGGLEYEISPVTPLGPGLEFTLLVDAETGVELRDARHTYREIEQRLKTTGSKEPAPPEPGRKKPKKKR